ncbi:MAG: hypothetical protein ACKVUS_12430 [Saprospiraceae bacterium]
MTTQTIKSSLVFWLHVLSVIGAWLMPFLISWKIALAIYAAVMLQFAIWGKCLVNEHHGLDESGGRIFYTDLLEKMGFRPEPSLVKTIVRQWLYPCLAVVSIVWQVLLGNAPWWF